MMRIPVPEEDEVLANLPEVKRLKFLTTGGFKAVFRAEMGSGTTEALKAIFIPSEADGAAPEQSTQMAARAMREIEALKLCLAPCIVKLGSLKARPLRLGGRQYVVYSEEFVPGRSMRPWLMEKGRLDFATLLEVFRFLLDVIEEMVRIDHLHRDIKPDNIMVTGQSQRPFVILDMGVAYNMHGTQLTQGGAPGTTQYMAPELFSPSYKDIMDFRCDLYAAGLTAYELATESNPFAPKPEAQHHTQWRIMNEKPPALETIRTDLPAKFCRIIDRCFKRSPALRFSSVELVRKQLEEALR